MSNTGTVTLQIADLHGDVVATADPANGTAPTSYAESTEFGTPREGTYEGERYAWLGGAERSAADLGDIILMGVRLYNPVAGRFLSSDPISGGSANAYDYAGQDPVNDVDLRGTNTIPGNAGAAWMSVGRRGGHYFVRVGFALRGERRAYLTYAEIIVFWRGLPYINVDSLAFPFPYRRWEHDFVLPGYIQGSIRIDGYITAYGFNGWFPMAFHSGYLWAKAG